MNRRKFLGALAAAGVSSLFAIPKSVLAATTIFPVPTNVGITGKKVVIVGGGMAGVALAKYLRLWGGTGLAVTLIEKDVSYISNIMSNKVLTGQKTISNLTYKYDTLVNSYGVTRVTGEVNSIDALNKKVTLKTGASYTYDRLVLAAGLIFDLMPGMTSLTQYDTLIPHAWKAGAQTTLLRQQLLDLAALKTYGSVVITIPKSPYRCPPGPYERACVIADWIKTNSVNSNVVVLDANPEIQAEKANFEAAFASLGVFYYHDCVISNIDPTTKTVTFTGKDISNAGFSGSITAGVLNPIPPQRAPDLLKNAGLLNANSNTFAGVNVLTYGSTALPNAGIHIIGDACAAPNQPKAGHIANQEAKVCADAIVRAFMNLAPDPAPVTNSACFTPITATTATWLSAVYQYDSLSGKMVIPPFHNPDPSSLLGRPIASSPVPTTSNYDDMLKWFDALMADTFS